MRLPRPFCLLLRHRLLPQARQAAADRSGLAMTLQWMMSKFLSEDQNFRLD
jgi:hypothetical protein